MDGLGLDPKERRDCNGLALQHSDIEQQPRKSSVSIPGQPVSKIRRAEQGRAAVALQRQRRGTHPVHRRDAGRRWPPSPSPAH